MKIKWFSAVVPLLFWGCSTSHQIDTHNEVNVKPIEIKPIHITIDINVKVDKELDNFFGDVDKAEKDVRKQEAIKGLAEAKSLEKAPEVKTEAKTEVKAPEVKTEAKTEVKAPEKNETQPQSK